MVGLHFLTLDAHPSNSIERRTDYNIIPRIRLCMIWILYMASKLKYNIDFGC